jgi:hypothetical protein
MRAKLGVVELCCGRQTKSRRAKTPKDQNTIPTTIAKDETHKIRARVETTPTNTETDRIPGNP